MSFRFFVTMLLTLGITTSAYCKEQQKLPDQIYPILEYILSRSQTDADIEPQKLSELITFVSSQPTESSMVLKERQGASGAFHGFSVQRDLGHVLDYAYNPNIPTYVTMPSSIRGQKWLTPQIANQLQNLPREIESTDDIRLLRGRDREAITPNTNTGGYYVYDQERLVTILPGPTGPVLISVSSQTDLSEVGKKGCIVGDDKDWNYLFSDVTGLNKTGMGWVDSYMYYADSILIYVADSQNNVVHVGSFKWLNAGWAKINMVKSSHILAGMKRFSSAFKTVLEAPGLPAAPQLASKYQELLQSNEENLRQMVSSYLQTLMSSKASALRSDPFKSQLHSGEYLERMSHEDMVRVLMLEHVKKSIGKEPPVRVAAKPSQPKPSATLFRSNPNR